MRCDDFSAAVAVEIARGDAALASRRGGMPRRAIRAVLGAQRHQRASAARHQLGIAVTVEIVRDGIEDLVNTCRTKVRHESHFLACRGGTHRHAEREHKSTA